MVFGFGKSSSRNREKADKDRRDRDVRDVGPKAARNIRRAEGDDDIQVDDFDDTWD